MGFNRREVEKGRRAIGRRDPVMRGVIRRVGPFTLRAQRDRYRMLTRSIIYQQISTKAANSIWQKFEALFPDRKIEPGRIRFLSENQLRAAGISPQKARYLCDLDRCVTDGVVQLKNIGRKADEEVIVELTQVKGIGRWTAQMFLIFSLGRLDVLPVGDLGFQTAVQRLYGLSDLPDAHTVEQVASPWRPYATIATWYCWRSLEST